MELQESTWSEYKLPCPKCGGSDPVAKNKNGSAKCFSCGTFFSSYEEAVEGKVIQKNNNYKKGSTFVAKGTLYNGGVIFALSNGNLPSGRAIVTNPGNFDVIFEVPHDGMYTVGVANYLGTYNALENRLQAKIGWVEKN